MQRMAIWSYVVFILTGVFAIACGHLLNTADKQAFLELIKELPHKGEFFTDPAVDKAVPYTGVLLSLTEQDLSGRDLYPFLALSRGLCDREEPRRYALRHFSEIAHPEIQMFWAVMLFDKNIASPEIVGYLNAALKSNERAGRLAKILGPGFRDFEERVHKAAGR